VQGQRHREAGTEHLQRDRSGTGEAVLESQHEQRGLDGEQEHRGRRRAAAPARPRDPAGGGGQAVALERLEHAEGTNIVR
jgi:hypothetical protein